VSSLDLTSREILPRYLSTSRRLQELPPLRPARARTLAAFLAPLVRRDESDVALRGSKHPGEHPAAVDRVLVVQARSGLVGEPPTTATGQRGRLDRNVEARTPTRTGWTPQKHPAASPDGIRSNFPPDGDFVPRMKCARRRSFGAWTYGCRAVPQERGVPLLGP